MSPVAPPAANTWTVGDVVAAALAVMRLSAADADNDRIEHAAVAACARIDSWLDHTDATTPTPTMRDAAVQVTIELYRRKDAPFGTADAWSTDTVAVEAPTSVLAGVRSELMADKARWGLA